MPKGFGAIVFALEQLFPPYIPEEELVLEILRLKTQSMPLYGRFDLDAVPYPDRRAIIEDARAFERWAARQRAADPDFGVHTEEALVNSTLIALKRYLLIAHGVVEFNKFRVIDQYLAHQPPLVNGEVFAFIRARLSGGGGQIDRARFERMLRWHDELYRAVNRLTLSKD